MILSLLPRLAAFGLFILSSGFLHAASQDADAVPEHEQTTTAQQAVELEVDQIPLEVVVAAIHLNEPRDISQNAVSPQLPSRVDEKARKWVRTIVFDPEFHALAVEEFGGMLPIQKSFYIRYKLGDTATNYRLIKANYLNTKTPLNTETQKNSYLNWKFCSEEIIHTRDMSNSFVFDLDRIADSYSRYKQDNMEYEHGLSNCAAEQPFFEHWRLKEPKCRCRYEHINPRKPRILEIRERCAVLAIVD